MQTATTDRAPATGTVSTPDGVAITPDGVAITPDSVAITPDSIIARLATRHPATIRVFQRHGIDFCCQGGRPLSAACAEKALPFAQLQDELAAAAAGPAGETRDWDEAPLAELIDHILDRYHQRLREDLPRLDAMAAKVLVVHGEKHPETLPALAATLGGLRAELESHMMKEEQVLFPAVRGLESAAGGGGQPAALGLSGPIAMMEDEHDDAARALAELRRLTGGFQPPVGACTTFRGLYHGLAELESDTHRHIHLENNVLFPRAARLEAEK
jgi:regulator of cell morphogenesis and NO signaling